MKRFELGRNGGERLVYHHPPSIERGGERNRKQNQFHGRTPIKPRTEKSRKKLMVFIKVIEVGRGLTLEKEDTRRLKYRDHKVRSSWEEQKRSLVAGGEASLDWKSLAFWVLVGDVKLEEKFRKGTARGG